MKRWRRPLILITLLLLAGAAVNVAVAIGIASGCGHGQLSYSTPPPPAHPVPVPSFHVSHARAGLLHRGSHQFRWRCLPPLPGGVWLVEETQFYEDGTVRFGTLATGWPLLTFRFGYDQLSETAASGRLGGLAAPDWLVRPEWFDLTSGQIPADPLPVAFAINTLFYAALMGAVALPLSVFPIRRRLRACRGRCPKCGYDLAGLSSADRGGEGGAPCPECGATR